MRFHKFTGGLDSRELAVDLDQVLACEQASDSPSKTELWLPDRVTINVNMPLDDVLALISPPAAPDTYEERQAEAQRAAEQYQAQLAKQAKAIRNAGPGPISIKDFKLTTEADAEAQAFADSPTEENYNALRAAVERKNERLTFMLKDARFDELNRLERAYADRGYLVPAFLVKHIDWRREAIRKGEPTTAVPMEG